MVAVSREKADWARERRRWEEERREVPSGESDRRRWKKPWVWQACRTADEAEDRVDGSCERREAEEMRAIGARGRLDGKGGMDVTVGVVLSSIMKR